MSDPANPADPAYRDILDTTAAGGLVIRGSVLRVAGFLITCPG
jgi:hypothetical protein